MPQYAHHEYRFAKPIADGLIQDLNFRIWLIEQTRFAKFSKNANLLNSEQKAKRSRKARNWWASYWVSHSGCACLQCGERETDLLAIFSTPNDFRFALHIEVKSPSDKFRDGQAKDYGLRAKCWAGRKNSPQTVLPHNEASTILVCSNEFASLNSGEADQFDTVITFEALSLWLNPYPRPL